MFSIWTLFSGAVLKEMERFQKQNNAPIDSEKKNLARVLLSFARNKKNLDTIIPDTQKVGQIYTDIDD